jgi:hypothetical protein
VLVNSDAQRARICELTERGATGQLRHCLTAAVEIRGPAEEDRWRARLARIVANRPALRSVFGSAGTHRLAADATPTFRRDMVDAPVGASADERWRIVHRMARVEARWPFALGETPLVRATLLSADDDHHLLLVTADPLVCDAWSANLLIEDLLRDDGERGPDEYAAAWRARSDWLEGARGEEAIARRQGAVAGAWLRWPMTGSPDPTDPDEPAERFVDFGDDLTRALRDQVRRARGSMLAVGAAALALSASPDASVPLALTSTLAARETLAEENVVGWLSNDAIFSIPVCSGTLSEYLTLIRGEIFAALRDQRAPYERVGQALHGGQVGAGLSFALLYLPSSLSGGNQMSAEDGGAAVRRAAVSICPTGADVDVFMVEQPPYLNEEPPPLLRLGVSGRRGVLGTAGAERILNGWVAAMTLLAREDWADTPASAVRAPLRDGGSAA